MVVFSNFDGCRRVAFTATEPRPLSGLHRKKDVIVPTDDAKLIIRAAKQGDLATVRAILKKNKAMLSARDIDGSTPLHCASWKGHVEVAEALLDAGADIRGPQSHRSSQTAASCGGAAPLTMTNLMPDATEIEIVSRGNR